MEDLICSPGAGNNSAPGEGSAEQNNIESANFWKAMKTRNFELIELPVNVNQGIGRLMFPDIPQLRGTILKALETWSVVNVTVSPNGLPVINAANCAFTYVGLFVNGKDQIVRMPLVTFNRMKVNSAAYGAGVDEIQEFDNLQGVDWSKSYIYFAAAPVATAFAVLFGVHYQ